MVEQRCIEHLIQDRELLLLKKIMIKVTLMIIQLDTNSTLQINLDYKIRNSTTFVRMAQKLS